MEYHINVPLTKNSIIFSLQRWIDFLLIKFGDRDHTRQPSKPQFAYTNEDTASIGKTKYTALKQMIHWPHTSSYQ